VRLLTLIFLTISGLFATSSYENGKSLYLQKSCFTCHGNKAEGMHKYPMLANRAKGFLANKLRRFRAKQSNSQQQEMMVAYAIGLSDQDIEDLTTFLSDYKEDGVTEEYDDSYNNWGDGGS